MSRHSKMSTAFFSRSSTFYFSTSKIHSCEIRSTERLYCSYSQLFVFAKILWWYICIRNIHCNWNLNQCVLFHLCEFWCDFVCWIPISVTENFSNRFDWFLYRVIYGCTTEITFSRIKSIAFTCSHLRIGPKCNRNSIEVNRHHHFIEWLKILARIRSEWMVNNDIRMHLCTMAQCTLFLFES